MFIVVLAVVLHAIMVFYLCVQRDRCGQEKVGDANAADSSIQRSKSDHNPRDLLSATDDKLGRVYNMLHLSFCWPALGQGWFLCGFNPALSLGSSKRKLSPADRESVENSCKKSKPTRKFCSICGDSFYSKNMARHSKSKTHIYNEKKGAGSKPYPSKAKIIIVPASVLSTYISSDNLEPFKQALLREGYMFEH